MEAPWYFAQQGQRVGPVSSTQLKELAASGRLQPSDLVWKEGMAQWAAASEIKGLFPTATQAAAPETPPPLPVVSTGHVVDDSMQRLSQLLSQAGWHDLGKRSHVGIIFDLVGSRRFLFTKWNILVRRLQCLDRLGAEVVAREFEAITSKSKSLLWGSCFLLCIVAEQVDPALKQAITSDDFGVFGVVRLRGGGGNVLIADIENKRVHGKVPTLPFDVHKFTKQAKDILSQTFTKTQI